MKIALFYHLPFGGAKRVVKEHVKGLTALGHSVDIYSINPQKDIFDPGVVASKEFGYEFVLKNWKIPFLSRLIKDYQIFYSLPKLHKKIAHDIDLKSYDIVLVHTDTYTQSPYLLRFLKTSNVYYCLEPLRIVYEYSLDVDNSLHGLNRLYEIITRALRKKIDRDNARCAMHTVALSLFGREYMIHAYNLYPRVVYLGVDTKCFYPAKLKKKRQVLFVAEKEYIYGYDLAEAAMSLIPQNIRPEMKLVFGTKRSQRISESELVKMYSESLVTLSLSRYDTFGLVPLESMASGTPVIALNVGGYREVLGFNSKQYLVEFDPQIIADKILEYVENSDLSIKLGKEGRGEVIRNWGWEKQIKKLESILLEVKDVKKE